MKKLYIFTISCVLFLLSTVQAKVTIHTIGDSTMANKSTSSYNREVGWGQVFSWFVDTAQVAVVNYAMDGRSTKSFINEGRWTTVLNNLKTGDYVFIEFGHNDEKYFDASLYANSATTYRTNLAKFVNESRAKGAIPVLLTSIVRRSFDADGHIADTHGLYPAAMRRVADSLKVVLIDLELKTRRMESIAGLEGTKKIHLYFNPNETPYATSGKVDNTHLSEYGASNIAFLVSEGINELSLPIALNRNFHNFLIKNWSFEYGTISSVPLDWKLEKTLGGSTDIKVSTATPKDRTYKYSIWASSVTSINLYQDVTLPAGQYQLSTSMHTSTAGDVTNQHLYVQVDGGTEIASNTLTYDANNYWIPLSLTFTVPAGSTKVRIGARSTGTGTSAGHFTLDNVKLQKTDGLTSLGMAYASLNVELANANNKLTTYASSPGYSAYQAAINEIQPQCSGKTLSIDGIVAAVQKLRDAETACKWTNSYPLDATFAVGNPGFEEGVLFPNGYNIPMGWSLNCKIGGSTTVGTSNSTPAEGTYKYSVWSSAVTAINLYQDVKLTAGKYNLSVNLHTTAASDITNQHFYAKVGSDSISSSLLTFDAANYWAPVSFNFTVPVAGTVRLGAASTGTGTSAGHFMIDKISLQKLSEIASDVQNPEEPQSQIKMYPIKGGVVVSAMSDTNISVVNLVGQIVKNKVVSQPEFLRLNPGVYIVNGKKIVVG